MTRRVSRYSRAGGVAVLINLARRRLRADDKPRNAGRTGGADQPGGRRDRRPDRDLRRRPAPTSPPTWTDVETVERPRPPSRPRPRSARRSRRRPPSPRRPSIQRAVDNRTKNGDDESSTTTTARATTVVPTTAAGTAATIHVPVPDPIGTRDERSGPHASSSGARRSDCRPRPPPRWSRTKPQSTTPRSTACATTPAGRSTLSLPATATRSESWSSASRARSSGPATRPRRPPRGRGRSPGGVRDRLPLAGGLAGRRYSFGAWLGRIAVRNAVRRAKARRPVARIDPTDPDRAVAARRFAERRRGSRVVALRAERADEVRRAVSGSTSPTARR